MAATVVELAEQYGDRVRFTAVDIDEQPRLAERYEVEGVPTILLFQHGREVARLGGTPSAQELTEQLNELL